MGYAEGERERAVDEDEEVWRLIYGGDERRWGFIGAVRWDKLEWDLMEMLRIES